MLYQIAQKKLAGVIQTTVCSNLSTSEARTSRKQEGEQRPRHSRYRCCVGDSEVMLSPHLFQWLFEYAFVQAEIIKQFVVFEK